MKTRFFKFFIKIFLNDPFLLIGGGFLFFKKYHIVYASLNASSGMGLLFKKWVMGGG
jgi:hypothetical protein